jgi:glycosyltransferase involved in cell wall biosynthesis
MDIAIVTSGYMPVPASLGGAVECLDDYLIKENERKKKCKITVFSAYDEKAEKIAEKLKNTTVKFIKTPAIIKFGDWLIYHAVKCLKPEAQTMSYRYILKRLYFIERVSGELEKNDYDKVMIENHATLLMTMKKRNNYKKYEGRYIYHLHNEQNKLYGCEKVLKNIKKIATVSNYISECIKEKVPGLSDDQVEVWRNCVDNTRFGNPQIHETAWKMKKQYGIQNHEIVVLFTGRLSPEKGIKELLYAFEKVKNKNVRLVIAGGYLSGDSKVSNIYEDELKRIAEKRKDNIIFTGFVDYADMPAMYKMADIVVIPSLVNDAAPLTVIEAMTSGIPLITTNSGGIPEYADRECAIILERNETLIDNMAEAIDKLASDSDLRKKMSDASLKISKNWTIEKYYSRFLECMEII